MPIQILTEQTIGKIAAGEVIERPVSIVKELLENAIDSEATTIAIEIREGGLREIRVSDNGSGIPQYDLPLAVHRHATSKLRAFEDLAEIQTLGFRGEALSSIAAVSRLQIRTTTPGSGSGSMLTTAYGSEPMIEPAAPRPGTTVTVNDLFLNVPARLKFLRQPQSEANLITRMATAYAAALPHIAFSLTHEGRQALSTDGRRDLTATATSCFGVEVGMNALLLPPLDESAQVQGVSTTGWISSPVVTRSHRQQLHFFVNGRLIQHRTLSFVVEECFHTLLMVGRHPLGVISIQVDPAAVDVNVHPTKAEVRFVDERSVARAVRRSVHAALVNAPGEEIPHITFSIPGVPAQAPTMQQPTLLSSQVRIQSSSNDEEATYTPAKPDAVVPMLRVLGQVSGTYIIAEGPDGLYLIDQHAAHERVMYEKLRDQVNGRMQDIQPMLDPIVIDLDEMESAVMSRSIAELNQIGFSIDEFGPQSFSIRAIPAMMVGVDIRDRMHAILGELAEGGAGDSWFDSVAISAACHTSIRAGQVLSIAEMRELVTQLEQTEHPRACGHGRPTMLRMSQFDLEKQFSRR
jgi:DNA mismatch repair protein MutL